MGKNNLKGNLLLLAAITGLAIGGVSCGTNPTKPSGPTFSMVSPFQCVTIGGTAAGNGNGQFNIPTDLAFDRSGNIYVMDSGNNRIQKFDANGNFLMKWNINAGGMGIAVDSNNFVYVTSVFGFGGNDAVYKYDSNANPVTLVTLWGGSGSSNGNFDDPYGIAIDKNGDVFVSESTTGSNGIGNRIQKFDGTGRFILKWGTFGSGDGQFDSPYQLDIDSNGFVYVNDLGNKRVETFDNNGNYVAQWGYSSFFAEGGLSIDQFGSFYLTGSDGIYKFESNGNYVLRFGSQGSDLGQYSGPLFSKVDKNNNVWVAERFNNRVQMASFPYGISNFDTFGIFPNPTHGGQQAGFEIGLNPGSAFSISIKDSLGTVVNQYQGQTSINPCILQWNMTSSGGSLIDPGTYFVIFQSGSIQKTQQLTYVR